MGFLHSRFKISKVIALLSYRMITWSKATKIIQLLMMRLKVGLRCENISLCQHRPKHGKAHREFKCWFLVIHTLMLSNQLISSVKECDFY